MNTQKHTVNTIFMLCYHNIFFFLDNVVQITQHFKFLLIKLIATQIFNFNELEIIRQPGNRLKNSFLRAFDF